MRQLINRIAADKSAEARAARVILYRPLAARTGIQPHRPELQHAKGHAIQPHPFLHKECAAALVEPDKNRHNQHNWRKHNQTSRRKTHIHHALERKPPAAQTHITHCQYRQTAQVIHRNLPGHNLKRVRNHLDVDIAALAARNQRQQLVMCRTCPRNDDFINCMLRDDLLQVLLIAQHRHSQHFTRTALAVDQAHQLIAKMRRPLNPLHHNCSHFISANNHQSRAANSLMQHVAAKDSVQPAPKPNQHNAEHPRVHQDCA